MKWKIASAAAGVVGELGELYGRQSPALQEILRVEIDFDGAELQRLRPSGPELPMARLYLELDLNGPGLHHLYRHALANKSGLTQALHGSFMVRLAGARRR